MRPTTSASRPLPTAMRAMPVAGVAAAAPQHVALPTAAKGRPATPSQSSVQTGFPIGMRPPTQASGARPGTQSRPPGTALGSIAAVIPSSITQVTIQARPVTQQGLSGMGSKSLGPQRQVADKNYFITELRNRINEINTGITQLNRQQEQIATDNATYIQLERKFELTMRDVRQLEGQLADFNLAFDKLRSNTSPSELHQLYTALKQRNDNERRLVDEVFLAVQRNEKQRNEAVEKIEHVKRAVEDRLREEDTVNNTNRAEEWNEWNEEISSLQDSIRDKEFKLIELESQILQHNETLKSESYAIHQHGVALLKQSRELTQQKLELEDELNSTLSPAQLKDRLTARIKEMNVECADLEKQLQHQESKLDELQNVLQQRENELNEVKNHASKSSKYEAIFQRDAKMTEFIDSFNKLEQSEKAKITLIQQTIVALLQHISKQVIQQQQIGDVAAFNELKSELSFKQEKLQASQLTLDQLEREQVKRQEELDKIEALDSKIGSEITALQEKMLQWTQEVAEFKSEEQIKQEAIERKKQLLQHNAQIKQQLSSKRQDNEQLQQQFQQLQNKLQSNSIFTGITEQEKKLQQFQQANYSLEELLWKKKKQSDFTHVKQLCMTILQQINQHLIQQQTTKSIQ